MSLPDSSARWLVTGAAGQLGRSLLAIAADRGIEAVGCTHAELDVADPAAVRAALDRIEPGVVLNAAAFTQVDLCEQETEAALRVNAHAPGVLAEACRDRGQPTLLVHVSTEYVFSGETPRPIPEDADTAPLSAYGRGKLAGEQAVRDSGAEHLIARTQWLFGPGPNFVRTILAAAGRGQALRVVEDQIGRPTWSRSLAEGLVSAVRGGLRGTLHLACEGVCSWYDLAREIVREGAARGLTGTVGVDPIPTREMPRPAVRPAYAVLALDRSRAAGIHMPHWRDALAAYLDEERSARGG
ncbi:MAG: dTDP-4-dehydrorhamnose reductase [Deltaproteobacteria bacterium]|nr:dTDP-4-dehydrorhamnose reductase [Deltaproteobacteria bacterium]MBW2416800.1 dTDP-4-dehydrorhamnose reductase [Deltaproteobacteria bacterium]